MSGLFNPRKFWAPTGREENVLPVNVVHAERLDAVLSEQLLLTAVHVPQTDVDQLARAHDVLVLQPAEDILLLLAGQPSQEGHGHAVDVSAGAHLGNVDVGMGVNPDDGHFAAQPFADGLGGSGDGTDGDRVVTSQGQDELAVLGMLVDLGAQGLGHGTHGTGLLHASVVGVGGGDLVLVVVDLLVVVKLVTQILMQLVEETGLDQSLRGRFDTGLALKCKSTVVSSHELSIENLQAGGIDRHCQGRAQNHVPGLH